MTLGLVHALESAYMADSCPLIHLIGIPYATVRGMERHLTDSHSRLLAYLAFNRGGHDRRYVARTLWPDASEARAAGNLRAALWRLRHDGIGVVKADEHLLSMLDGVIVDIQLIDDWATRLIGGSPRATDIARVPKNIAIAEILPRFADDWIEGERQRLQQRMFNAMECLSRELMLTGRSSEALDAALVVCHADPLRESAQLTLIEAHLSEGNLLVARRRFEEYRKLVRDELGVEPSPELIARMAYVFRRHS